MGVAGMLQNRFCKSAASVGLVVLVALVATSQIALAQDQAAPTAQASSTEIHAVLEKIVHPKKVKVGDEVVARTTEATKLKDGTDLPKGTHIVGKVTEIKLKADKEGPSKLGLLFDKAQLKDGKDVSIT